MKSRSEIINRIYQLTQTKGFFAVFCTICIGETIKTSVPLETESIKDRLIYSELSFIANLMNTSKFDIEHIPSRRTASKMHKRLFHLMHQLHRSYFPKRPASFLRTLSKKGHKEGLYSLFQNTFSSFEEQILYSDTGCSDFQMLELVQSKYQLDSDFLLQEYSIQIPEFTELIKSLLSIRQKKFQFVVDNKKMDYNSLIDSVLLSEEEIPAELREIFHLYKSHFIIEIGKSKETNSFGKHHDLHQKPIIELKNGVFFIPVPFYLSNSLWETPFYLMKDSSDYFPIAQHNRGIVSENIVFQILGRVFKSNIFKGVKIIKSRKATLTDIDILIFYQSKAIIIQVKSKTLTEASRLGSVDNLKSDFSKAIQHAYEQAKLSKSVILNPKRIEKFVDDSGKTIEIPDGLNGAFIICVTMDNYPAVISQTFSLLDDVDKSFNPVIFNTFDIDLITTYLKTPYEFLYYLHLRSNSNFKYIVNSEITYLSYHLRNKLYNDSPNDYFFLLDDLHYELEIDFTLQKIESNYPINYRHIKCEWINDDYKLILEAVSSIDHPNTIEVLFFLLDIAGAGGNDLLTVINHCKSQTKIDRKLHDTSLGFNFESKSITGITFMSFPNDNKENLEYLIRFGQIKKYTNMSNLWIVLGSSFNSERVIDMIGFNNSEWIHSPVLDYEFRDFKQNKYQSTEKYLDQIRKLN